MDRKGEKWKLKMDNLVKANNNNHGYKSHSIPLYNTMDSHILILLQPFIFTNTTFAVSIFSYDVL